MYCQVGGREPFFEKGDKVFCHGEAYAERGEVVDTVRYQGVWLVMVNHGDMEFAYSPYELSLIPDESDNKVMLVNFKTKKHI